MRDYFLVAAIGLGLIATFQYPFAGILLWTWFTCMDPHQEVFSFAKTLPLNQVIVGVTIISLLMSKERKFPAMETSVVALIFFLVWMTFNSFFAVDPDWSWPLWDRTWRIIALGLLIIPLATTKVRIHAIIWVVVLSLMYYGIKGGIFTVMTGGGGHVLGPIDSIIGDNNHLAVALLIMLPLANYLRTNTQNRYISRALLAGMALSVVAVFGTYSRGGLVTLVGLSAVAWLRTRNRLVYPIVAVLIILPGLWIMPQSYDDRMSTIKSAQSDDSFEGRVQAWQVAWDYASEHFPIGDGFSGAELPQVFNHYLPKADTHAAHSIFFQVLGDLGFMGLAIYLVILVTAIVNFTKIKRLARGHPELTWAFDLANMMQLSLFAFCLGGSALSLAYYDVFFISVALSSALRAYVAKQVSEESRTDEQTIVAAGRSGKFVPRQGRPALR